MYLADYHTHTQFSPDAHDPMTVMTQAALDAGMDEMGEVDDSAGLEDAEGVDDRIASHGRVS